MHKEEMLQSCEQQLLKAEIDARDTLKKVTMLEKENENLKKLVNKLQFANNDSGTFFNEPAPSIRSRPRSSHKVRNSSKFK